MSISTDKSKMRTKSLTFILISFFPFIFHIFEGPKGLDLVKGVLDKRFGGRWSPTELDLISTYLYHISAAPALGEYSLNSLLEIITTTDKIPISADVKKNVESEDTKQDLKQRKSKTFIYAREPLVERLHELPRTLPVLVLFGDNDWLYNPADVINSNIRYLKNGGANDQNKNKFRSSTAEIKEITAKRDFEIIEKKKEDFKCMNNMDREGNEHFAGIDITMQVIPGAGHHIYLDNAKGFTYSITSWLKLKGLL